MDARTSIAVASIASMLLGCSPQVDAGSSSVAAALRQLDPTSDDDEVIYGLGLMTAQSLSLIALTPREREIFEQALRDHREGKVRIPLHEVFGEIPKFQRERAQLARQQQADAGAKLLESAAAEPGARKLDTGTVVRQLTPPSDAEAASPTYQDAVVVRFETRLPDGTVVDGSEAKGGPQTYAFNGTLACWADVLPQMKPGEKVQVTCPTERAYSEIGQAPLIPPGAALQFDLELESVLAGGARMHGGSMRMPVGPLH